MASAFQRNGKWYASYKGVDGWKKKAVGDKAGAEQLASALEYAAMLRREGLVDPKADALAAAEKRPLADHLADFKRDILARRGNEKHATATHQRAERLLAGVASVSAITPAAVNENVRALREGGKHGKASLAHHLRAVKAFTRWLVRNGRTRDDALIAVRVPGTVAKSERVRVRRALSRAEFERLVTHTAAARVFEGMCGADRAMLYRLAGATGFRQDELRSLTPESFDLKGDDPAITVRAAYSKRRRDDRQPIAADLAAVVKPWLDGKVKSRPVFNLPEGWKIAAMIRADAAAARAVWVGEVAGKAQVEREASSFLADADASGNVLDFHALRVSYISWLVESGASVKTCQELARHSTPVLTIGVYARMSLQDQGKALAGLPVAGAVPAGEPMAMRATGTDEVIHGGSESDGKRVGKTPGNSSGLRMTRDDNEGDDSGARNTAYSLGKTMDLPVLAGQNTASRLGGGTADAEDLKSSGE
jgi:integrase